MKGTLLKEKPQPPAVRAALKRQSEQCHKELYARLIDSSREHIKTCKKPRCIECKDAKALIPYYRTQSKRGPAF
jgi:hypothetical protein